MSFEPGGIEAMPISFRLLRIVREIGEYRGRQDLFRQQSPQVLESLRQVALIQSTESSNRIEGVTAPVERIRSLVAGNAGATRIVRSRRLQGYRDVLGTIHANAADIPFTANVVLQLHRDLYQFLPGEGGYWKRVDNEIVETGSRMESGWSGSARSPRTAPRMRWNGCTIASTTTGRHG